MTLIAVRTYEFDHLDTEWRRAHADDIHRSRFYERAIAFEPETVPLRVDVKDGPDWAEV